MWQESPSVTWEKCFLTKSLAQDLSPSQAPRTTLQGLSGPWTSLMGAVESMICLEEKGDLKGGQVPPRLFGGQFSTGFCFLMSYGGLMHHLVGCWGWEMSKVVVEVYAKGPLVLLPGMCTGWFPTLPGGAWCRTQPNWVRLQGLPLKPGMMAHDCKPGIWKAEAEELQVQTHPGYLARPSIKILRRLRT